MNVHCFKHVPFEGIGSIRSWADGVGANISLTRFHAGDFLPSVNDIDWLIIMGGPMRIYDEKKYPWLETEKRFINQAITKGKVVLGICLGAQLLAHVLGARVYRHRHKEIGWFPIRRADGVADSAFEDAIPDEIEVLHWHGDTFELPPETIHLASSVACENQGFAHGDRVVGIQFHLETRKQDLATLIENSIDDITEGPYIQNPEEMLAKGSRFSRVNGAMDRLLDHILTHTKNL